MVISDQGREFVNQVGKDLFSITLILNTEHRQPTPQTNGLTERFNQTLQRALIRLDNNSQNNWDEKLDGILFAYRISQQASSNVTPFELMYCR